MQKKFEIDNFSIIIKNHHRLQKARRRLVREKAKPINKKIVSFSRAIYFTVLKKNR